MSRSFGLVGAASACMFLFAGCAVDAFSLTALGPAPSNGPVMAGSLDATTIFAQRTLGDMGLFVSMHRDSDVVKLTSTTVGGKRFTLVLKARKTDRGDETQASIEWEKEADGAFWIQLAGALTNMPKPSPSRVSDAPPAWLPPPAPPAVHG